MNGCLEMLQTYIFSRRGAETQRRRDAETQRRRDAETQRRRDAETQRRRDAKLFDDCAVIWKISKIKRRSYFSFLDKFSIDVFMQNY
jgi:hypothetical protein